MNKKNGALTCIEVLRGAERGHPARVHHENKLNTSHITLGVGIRKWQGFLVKARPQCKFWDNTFREAGINKIIKVEPSRL